MSDDDAVQPYLLSDEEFEDLEDLLTSDAVPEDCMDLEMLDGFLAGVIASPRPIPVAEWLPAVWSAHGDELSFASGSLVQRAIRLVLGYYNELVVTLGAEEGWEPFCYAAAEGDELQIGDEWVLGFAQGVELWPEDWQAALPDGEAGAVEDALEAIMQRWEGEDAAAASEETRLEWLEECGRTVEAIRARWQELGLESPQPVVVEAAAAPRAAGPGRNEPCPCGSGKKYKKCCGANQP